MWAQTLEPYSVDIALYGDSRVAGANWNEAFPEDSVVNLGIGGDIVEGTIQRLPLLEALDIKYCFLAIGGNNCGKNSFKEDDFRNKYDTLIKGLKDLGIEVYANTIAGVTLDNSTLDRKFINRMNSNIGKANQIIKELAEKHQVTLIDIASLMNNNDGTLKKEYSADGIHFTQLGNQLWYDTLLPYVIETRE